MKRKYLIFCLLLWWPLLQAATGAGAGRVLILNSDADIAKYRTVEKEFQANLTAAHTSLNLGSNGVVNPEQIGRTIQDYNPDVIYCIGTKALKFAQELAPERKRVFSSVVNWRRLPMDDKTFGVSNDLYVGMQVTLFRYLFPHLKRIGIVYSEKFNREWVEVATREAVNAGIEIVGYPTESPDQLEPILEKSLPSLDALWLIADPVVLADKGAVRKISQFGESHKKPVFSYSEVFANFGAALVLSVDLPTIARQAAMLTESLTQGQTAPKDRVLEPAGSHIALDKRKIARYGLFLNKDALGAVNTFIE